MKKIFLSLFFFTTLTGYSQTNEHPIDIKNQECFNIDTNTSMNKMIECEMIAREEWIFEMNKYYNLLLDTLSNESIELLKASQNLWHKYNENEIAFTLSFYHSDMNGAYHFETNEHLKNIVRKRALELKKHYSIFINE